TRFSRDWSSDVCSSDLFVFSSTAAVYQQTDKPEPLQEDSPLGPVNPYGENKLQVENMLDAAAKSWGLQSVIFRYFNAAGASLSRSEERRGGKESRSQED